MFFLNAILIMVAAACAPSKTGIDSTALTIVSLAALLGSFIIRWNLSMKLAKSFGKGVFFGLFLFLFGNFGRVILGLSSAQYVGKDDNFSIHSNPAAMSA